MRIRILRYALALTLSTCAYAACIGSPSCTVKAGGGGNYTTIQACATAMAAGDTCTVFVGTYAENVTVSAGTAGNLKTLTVNTGDTVNVLGFSSIGSHVKINGFHIQNASSPTTTCATVPDGNTDFYITNNTMANCGGPIIGHNAVVTNGYVQNNSITYPSSNGSDNNVGPSFTLTCNFCLVENNDISHTSDGFHFGGSHDVFRNNTMHDIVLSECTVSGNGGNCHVDFIESEPGVASQFNLYEGNKIINNPGANGHVFLLQADVCSGSCNNVIIRFNQTAHVGAAGVENDNQWTFVKVYNNSWVDNASNGQGGGVNDFAKSANNGSDFNDLFYFPTSINNENAICSAGCGTPNPTGFTAGYNLAWCTGSPCTPFGYTYEVGSWLDDATNLKADPLFVSYSSSALGDLHLQSGSPAIAAGHNMTSAVGSGSSSTALTVGDASFFFDGDSGSITGVSADQIRIGASTVAQICSINYSTNVITLCSSATWANAAGVYPYKDSSGNLLLTGASPDIGALPFTNPTPAPALGMFAELTH